MIGRQATSTRIPVSICMAKPVIAATASIATSSPGSERSQSPRTPAFTLSAPTTVSSTAEGNRLECFSGTQLPASAESMTKLCSSALTDRGCGRRAGGRGAARAARRGRSRPSSPSRPPVSAAPSPAAGTPGPFRARESDRCAAAASASCRVAARRALHLPLLGPPTAPAVSMVPLDAFARAHVADQAAVGRVSRLR